MKTRKTSDGLEGRTEMRTDWLLLALAFFGLYALATFSPQGAMWGLHSLGYFPVEVQLGGLALCLGLLFPAFQKKVFSGLRSFLQPFLHSGLAAAVFTLLLGSLAFALFYNFPIQTDIYGDSRNMLIWHADNTKLQSEWINHIFEPNLFASKEALTIAVHRIAAYVFSIPIGESYRVFSALSGALFLCLWLQVLRYEFAKSRWLPLLFVAGFFLGSHQLFFGHVENYPLPFFMSATFLVACFLTLEKRLPLWALLLLFFLAVKAHATAILFVPALLFLVAWRLNDRYPSIRHLLTWKRLGLILVGPSLLAGVFLYFFYFKSYNEPHAAVGRQFEHTFLPLFAAPPPLDNYALQSINHLLDLGNVFLLVGTPLLVPLLGIVLFHRRSVDWGHPRVIFSALALLYPFLFFAALNPELSMPRDWDLYALLGAPLLLFFTALLAHSDQRVPTHAVFGTAVAFSVFSLGFYVVNASPSKLSMRIEDIGEQVYRTYYAGASYIIAVGHRMEQNPAKALERRIATANRLASAVVGEDNQYAHLLLNIVSTYTQKGDLPNALLWMERAARIAPNDASLSLNLSQLYLSSQQTGKAEQIIERLLRRDPRNPEAIKQAAFAAVQRRDFIRALDYLKDLKEVAPGDPDLPSWTEQIRNMQVQQRKK